MRIKWMLFIIFLLPFFITSLFNQPSIDDFWSANVIRDYGRPGSVKYFYQTVSGRFFSNLIMSLLNTLPAGHTWIFKVWPILIIILLITAFVFFYSSLFDRLLSGKESLLASVFFVVLHIANMRSLYEGLYWMSSTVCYQLAICVFVIGIASLIRYIRAPSLLYAFLAISFSFLLPGTVEIAAPIFIIVLLAILIATNKRKHAPGLTLVCLMATICSTALVLFSKGNNIRVQNDAAVYDQSIFKALYYSTRAVVYYSLVWVTAPINIAAVILVLPALQKFSNRLILPTAFSYYNPILLIPVSYLICIIIYLPLTYFESSIPFPRITTVVFFIASHLAIIAFILMFKKYESVNRFFSYLHLRRKMYLYTWAFFFISALTSKNFLAVVKDLISGNAYNYDRDANNRYQILKNTKSDTCYVPLYKHWPVFIQSSEKQVINSSSFIHMDKYFGKTILYDKNNK